MKISKIVISNYKCIKERFVLVLDNVSTAIFGNLGTGKTTLVESLYDFYQGFLNGFKYSKNQVDNHTKYTFEFHIQNIIYAYEVVINFERHEIVEEILFNISKKEIYFKRSSNDLIFSALKKLFNETDFLRLQTYMYDLRFDRRSLILSELYQKDFSDSPQTKFIDYIGQLIHKMYIDYDNDFIKFYSNITDSHYKELIQLLTKLNLPIEAIKYKKLELDDLRMLLNRHRYDHLIDMYRNEMILSNKNEFFVYSYGYLLKLKGQNFDNLDINMLEFHFKDESVLNFHQLSRGLKSLLIKLMYLLRTERNVLYIVDDMFDSIDYKLSLEVIYYIKERLKNFDSAILFTTNQYLLFDQNVFNQKEMYILEYKNNLRLSRLDTLGIRKDKKLLNWYLEQ